MYIDLTAIKDHTRKKLAIGDIIRIPADVLYEIIKRLEAAEAENAELKKPKP